MKYCQVKKFISCSPDPAKDQTLLSREPITQFPGIMSPTNDAPAPHLSDPSASPPYSEVPPRGPSVAVGKRNMGPTPQVSVEDFWGEKKAEKVISPRPVTLPSP